MLTWVLARGVELSIAVAYMHKHHVCHLDLKPGNVMMDEGTGSVRVIDFDSASAVPRKRLARPRRGTKGWMAPEVNSRHSAGVNAFPVDIYGVGSLIIHLTRCVVNGIQFDSQPSRCYSEADTRLVCDELVDVWHGLFDESRSTGSKPGAGDRAANSLPSEGKEEEFMRFVAVFCDFLSEMVHVKPAKRPSADETLAYMRQLSAMLQSVAIPETTSILHENSSATALDGNVRSHLTTRPKSVRVMQSDDIGTRNKNLEL